MPNIYTQANRFRGQLLRHDEEARRRLRLAYEEVLADLDAQLEALEVRIAAAQAAGEVITESWLYRQTRYRILIQQTEAEIDRWALGNIALSLRNEQRRIIAMAAEHAEEFIGANFVQVPYSAVESLVGFAGDGSPLAALLRRYGAVSAQLIERSLVQNLASGNGIASAVREVRGLMHQPRWHAERLVRTELLRSYREAARLNYKANGIIEYEWLCSRSPRTCAACLWLDGQRFKVSKPMVGHPNCRCTMVPVLATNPKRQTGAQWFDAQPFEAQAETLGKANAARYRAGDATLRDFIRLKKSRKWGDSYSS